jgi:hypothetical protein
MCLNACSPADRVRLAVSQIESKRLEVIARCRATARHAAGPTEQGMTNFDASIWFGFCTTPPLP